MKKIFSFIKRLFSKAAKLIHKFVVPAIAIVDAIKNAVNSPAMPLLNAIIPGNLDDKLVILLKANLPKVLLVLRISEQCSSYDDPDLILSCAIQALKKYEPDGQAAAYHSIASLLSVYLSDGKLSWNESVHLVQAVYKKDF